MKSISFEAVAGRNNGKHVIISLGDNKIRVDATALTRAAQSASNAKPGDGSLPTLNEVESPEVTPAPVAVAAPVVGSTPIPPPV